MNDVRDQNSGRGRFVEQATRDRAAGPRIVDAVVDQHGTDVSPKGEWDRHPQMRRQPLRRLEPIRDESMQGYYDERYDERRPAPQDRRNGDVSVAVHNDGSYYRPWKEELKLSAMRTLGNAVAWPFRLVKGLVETILNGLAGLFAFVIKLLIIPTLLFVGYNIYQNAKDKPAAETAQAVGKESVGVLGGVLKGIWEGIAGKDEPTPGEPSTRTPPAKPRNEGGRGRD